MFSTFKSRLLLGAYIFLVLSIPIGAYLASQRQTLKSSASQPKRLIAETSPAPSISPAKDLLKQLEQGSGGTKLSDDSPTQATSFGPTLNLKATLEGRPQDNQATKMFVGIAEGGLTNNPKFLLSFTIDLPSSGVYSNLSLAGLTTGNKYTALLKGSAQIATSSAFIMSPAVTNLNDGQSLNLITGDLNDDNTINDADYKIVQNALGTTPKSSSWNDNIDLNKDGVINLFDLSIVSKNLGRTGDSGIWVSPPPKSATPSGSLTPLATDSLPVGSVNGSSSGYWMWIPK